MEQGQVKAAALDRRTGNVVLRVFLPGRLFARTRVVRIGAGSVTFGGVRVVSAAELVGRINNSTVPVYVTLHPETDGLGAAVNAEFRG